MARVSNRQVVMGASDEKVTVKTMDKTIVRRASQKSQTSMHFHDHTNTAEILTSLNLMRKRSQLTDVTIHVEQCSFPCHRAILACCSQYFLAMFSCDLKESDEGCVYLEAVDSEVVGLLIEYAYTSKIVIDESNVQALLETAQRLQFEKVVGVCCRFMEANLDPANCLGVMMFAEVQSCSTLYQAALTYSLDKFEEVCQQDEFKKLSAKQLGDYMSHDALNVSSEEVVYHNLQLWLHDTSDIDQLIVHQLLSCVRLHYLRPELLQSLLNIPELTRNRNNVDLVSGAVETQRKLQAAAQLQAVSCAKPRFSTMHEVMVIVGGYADNHSCTDVRFLNPVTTKWETLTHLPEPRSGYSVANLGNCIYVIGGKVRSAHSGSVYCYDCDADRWSMVANMNFVRQYHGSAIIAGQIYVAGGENTSGRLAKVERFDPRSNAWEIISDLVEPVSGPAVVAHRENLYVVGGQMASVLNSTYRHIQCFDTVTKQWTIIETLAITSRHFPVVMLNTYMYLLGRGGRFGIQVYDPDTDSCLPSVNMCGLERHLFAAVALQSKGTIMVAGGMRNYEALSMVEVFDPMKNCWFATVDMPRALRVHGCGVAIHRYLGPPFYS